MDPATPLFITDVMLGRLTTWLRLIGLDTAYAGRVPAAALLRRATVEGRILLTRNRRLLRRRGLPQHLYVSSDDFRLQLRQVLDEFGIHTAARLFARCSRCNEPLTPVEKCDVRERVPEYVFETQYRFARCSTCARVYWPATHVDRIKRELARL